MASEITGPVFVLDVAADADVGVVRLRLSAEQDRQLGDNQVRQTRPYPSDAPHLESCRLSQIWFVPLGPPRRGGI